jgi:hypothetical protein
MYLTKKNGAGFVQAQAPLTLNLPIQYSKLELSASLKTLTACQPKPVECQVELVEVGFDRLNLTMFL